MRQNFVSNEDNRFAQILINSFVEQFPNLYGTKNVTHNIHTSLHLPTQFVIENLDRFFLICKRSVNFDFIKIEDIVSKCVLLQQNEDYFVSIFNENDEIID